MELSDEAQAFMGAACKAKLMQLSEAQFVEVLEDCKREYPDDAQIWQEAIDIFLGKADHDPETDEVRYKLL